MLLEAGQLNHLCEDQPLLQTAGLTLFLGRVISWLWFRMTQRLPVRYTSFLVPSKLIFWFREKTALLKWQVISETTSNFFWNWTVLCGIDPELLTTPGSRRNRFTCSQWLTVSCLSDSKKDPEPGEGRRICRRQN